MNTRRVAPYLLCLLILVLPVLLAGPAAGQCGQPTSGPPGPARCYQGSGPGGLSGQCASCGTVSGSTGSPTDAVSTFSGNLYLQDTPVSYRNMGDPFPFTITYNCLSSRTGVMGDHWTHSYSIYVLNDAPNGARIVEGDGQENYFSGNPTQGSPFYGSAGGVWDKLQKTYSGSTWTGWKLTRTSQEYLTFDTNGRLTARSDWVGLSWGFSYTNGLLTTVTDPMGRQTTLTYTNGYLTRVTVPGSVYAQFAYDTDSPKHLVTVTDAANYAYTYDYDSNDRVVSVTDPSGREVEYTYYSSGRLNTTFTTGLSGTLKTYTYTTQTNGQLWVDLTETKDGASRVTRHVYENTNDPNNGRYLGVLLLSIKDAGDSPHLNLTEGWAYDAQYRKVRYRDGWDTETGGKSHRHFYYYGDANNPNRMTKYVDPENSDANPNETGLPSAGCPGYVYTYNSRGDKISEVTPEGRETDYAYVSGTSQLSSVTIKDQDVNGDPVDRVTSYTYYGSSKAYQLSTTTDAEGNVTTYDYSTSTGYLTSITPEEGGATSYGYNDLGDVTSVQDGNGNTTSYQYDNLHRVTQITYPSVGGGQKTKTTTWSCCGRTQETDENGVVTRYYYEDDKPTAVRTHLLWKVVRDCGTGRLNYTTEYTYDEVRNTKTEKNPRGKTTTYTHDAANRKTRVDYPDNTYEAWAFRDDGRICGHTDGRGRAVTFRYDADDRLCGPYAAGYPAVAYPNDTDVYLTRDEDGQVVEARDGSGTSTRTYYPSGWLKTVTVSAGSSKTLTYQYTGVGQVSSLQVTGENAFSYSYNGRNQISSVTNPNNVQVTFSYDDGGRRTRITYPGSYVEYVYNARDWITEVRNRTTGGTTRYDATYAYSDGTLWDHHGNPLKRTENIAGSTYTTTLRYDAVYRQTEETKRDSGNSVVYSLTYGYDECGNRTSRMLGNVTYTYVYDDNNKLSSASGGGLSASFTHDGNGNMTGVSGTMYGTKTMAYNDQSYLTSVGTDSYWYTYTGQRYRAQLAGSYRRYLYHGDRVLEELSDSGTMQARYTTENDGFYGMLVHLSRSDGTSRFPMYDEIGSVRGLTDASGSVTDTYELDTFGRQVSSSGTTPNPYRFGGAWGYITDPSGMLQLGARYYWPEIGAFLSRDPMPDTLPNWEYAEANPVRSIDPDGYRSSRGHGHCHTTPAVPLSNWMEHPPVCGGRCPEDNSDYGRWIRRAWTRKIKKPRSTCSYYDSCGQMHSFYQDEGWWEVVVAGKRECMSFEALEELGWCGYDGYPVLFF